MVVGDDRGAVHLLRFPHAAAGLLTRPRSEGLTALTWQVSTPTHIAFVVHANLHSLPLHHLTLFYLFIYFISRKFVVVLKLSTGVQ